MYPCISCALKALSVVTLDRCKGFSALSLEVPPGKLLQAALPEGRLVMWLCNVC